MGGLRSLVLATSRLLLTRGKARLSFPLGLRILPSFAGPACLRVGFASAFLLFAYVAYDSSPVLQPPLYAPGLDLPSRALVATTYAVDASPSDPPALWGTPANSPSSRPHKVRARSRALPDAAETAVNQAAERGTPAPRSSLFAPRKSTFLTWSPGTSQRLLDSP